MKALMKALTRTKRWWHDRFGCGMFWKHTTPFERHCTVCERSQRAMYTGDDWMVADWVDNKVSHQPGAELHHPALFQRAAAFGCSGNGKSGIVRPNAALTRGAHVVDEGDAGSPSR